MTEAINDTTIDSIATTAVPVVLTKEEKLAKIDAQIAKLQERRYNIEHGIVTTVLKKAKFEPIVPVVGDVVVFNFGRTTTTTLPVRRTGVVVAVKAAVVKEDGKRLPAQLKVQVGEGFDQEFVVIYPASVVTINAADTGNVEDADNAS